MSLVYITCHDENIFDIDKEDLREKHKQFKYATKYHHMVQKEAKSRHVVNLSEHRKLLTSSAKNHHQTMGYARTPLNPPCKFLRKHQGIQWQRLNEHVCPPKRPVPQVPRMGQCKPEKPPTPKEDPKNTPEKGDLNGDERGNCTSESGHTKHLKDFVTLNNNELKSAPARQRPPRYVDTPQGDVHDLLGSGLVPRYMCSKNFARVPCYIAARKKQLARLSETCLDAKITAENDYARIVEKLTGVRKLKTEERNKIIDVSIINENLAVMTFGRVEIYFRFAL